MILVKKLCNNTELKQRNAAMEGFHQLCISDYRSVEQQTGRVRELFRKLFDDHPGNGVPARGGVSTWVISTGPNPNANVHETSTDAFTQALHCTHTHTTVSTGTHHVIMSSHTSVPTLHSVCIYSASTCSVYLHFVYPVYSVCTQ